MQITKIAIWKSFRTCFSPKAVDFCPYMGEQHIREKQVSKTPTQIMWWERGHTQAQRSPAPKPGRSKRLLSLEAQHWRRGEKGNDAAFV